MGQENGGLIELNFLHAKMYQNVNFILYWNIKTKFQTNISAGFKFTLLEAAHSPKIKFFSFLFLFSQSCINLLFFLFSLIVDLSISKLRIISFLLTSVWGNNFNDFQNSIFWRTLNLFANQSVNFVKYVSWRDTQGNIWSFNNILKFGISI